MMISVIDSQKSIFYSARIRRVGKVKKWLWARFNWDAERTPKKKSSFHRTWPNDSRQGFPRNHSSVSWQQGIRIEMEVFGKGARPRRLLSGVVSISESRIPNSLYIVR